MAAVNPNWNRWIYASLARHLHLPANKPVPLIVAFLDKRGKTWNEAASKAEATITGPVSKELSQGYHRVWVDVFIKLTSNLDSNNYDHLDSAGTIANALDQCIEVKDYGATGLVDITELKPRRDVDGIEVIHVTPAEKDTQIHSTLNARYEGFITE